MGRVSDGRHSLTDRNDSRIVFWSNHYRRFFRWSDGNPITPTPPYKPLCATLGDERPVSGVPVPETRKSCVHCAETLNGPHRCEAYR